MDKAFIAELVMRSVAGDDISFRQLYDETNKMVFSTVFSIVRDNESAADIVQETYLCAWEKLCSINDPLCFVGWLNSIAANKSKNYLVRTKHLRFETPDEKLSELYVDESNGLSPEQQAEINEQKSSLIDLINSMSPEHKACIVMRYNNNMSISEIASALELPEGTVKSRLHYAKLQMKSMLDKSNILYAANPGAVIASAIAKESAENMPDKQLFNEVFSSISKAHYSSLNGASSFAAKLSSFFTVSRISAFVSGTIIFLGGMTLVLNFSGKEEISADAVYESDTAYFESHEEYDSTGDFSESFVNEDEGTVYYDDSSERDITFPESTTVFVPTSLSDKSVTSTTKKKSSSIKAGTTAKPAITVKSSAPTTKKSVEENSSPTDLIENEADTKTTVSSQTTYFIADTTSSAQTTTVSANSVSVRTTTPQTNPAADFSYVTVENGIAVKSYSGLGGSISIPSESNENTVAAIGASAFSKNSKITDITVPSSCKIIGDMAFSNCTGLKTVMLESGVMSIGTWAFYGCTSLSSINIPASVTSIADDAFEDCSSSFTIRCVNGSYAHSYASEHNINFTLI